MITSNPELERLREEARLPGSRVVELTFERPEPTSRERHEANLIYLMRGDGMVEIIKNMFDEERFTDWGGLHRLLVANVKRNKDLL